MRTRLALTALIVACALPLRGATLPHSYDGNPPGTLEELTGHTFTVGNRIFPAGTWQVDIGSRYTLWQDDQLIIQPLGLLVGNSRTFTATEPWHLDATTRDFPDGTPSDRWKFTELTTSPHPWQFGLEDMRAGDDDFQDAVGLITRVLDGPERTGKK